MRRNPFWREEGEEMARNRLATFASNQFHAARASTQSSLRHPIDGPPVEVGGSTPAGSGPGSGATAGAPTSTGAVSSATCFPGSGTAAGARTSTGGPSPTITDPSSSAAVGAPGARASIATPSSNEFVHGSSAAAGAPTSSGGSAYLGPSAYNRAFNVSPSSGGSAPQPYAYSHGSTGVSHPYAGATWWDAAAGSSPVSPPLGQKPTSANCLKVLEVQQKLSDEKLESTKLAHLTAKENKEAKIYEKEVRILEVEARMMET